MRMPANSLMARRLSRQRCDGVIVPAEQPQRRFAAAPFTGVLFSHALPFPHRADDGHRAQDGAARNAGIMLLGPLIGNSVARGLLGVHP
jgi:hypothetical protein